MADDHAIMLNVHGSDAIRDTLMGKSAMVGHTEKGKKYFEKKKAMARKRRWSRVSRNAVLWVGAPFIVVAGFCAILAVFYSKGPGTTKVALIKTGGFMVETTRQPVIAIDGDGSTGMKIHDSQFVGFDKAVSLKNAIDPHISQSDFVGPGERR